MKQVYLDYAATTPIDPKVLSAMLPYLKKDFGNASSLHSFGQKAREAVEKAREGIAEFLNCQIEEVFFTGSATESDNLAILGVVRAALQLRFPRPEQFGPELTAEGLGAKAGQAQKKGIGRPHVITSMIEHPAVLEPIKHLEKTGQIEVSYLAVGKEGIVKASDVEKVLKENTVLVSVMYANNEIGTIQPITEIAKVIRNFRNSKSQIPVSKQYPVFHCDAVQAANYLDCNVENLEVDLLTLSGHKIYGPKGIGVFYKKKSVEIEPIIFGGHQEHGIRPGTENVAAIVGFGAAITAISNFKFQISNLRKLRDKLLDGILKDIPGTNLNGSRENRLPNNANISFEGAEGESILMALNEKGVTVSTGSACASGSLEPSHVLMALGLSHQQAHGSIRFTLGRYTTSEEIDYVLKVLPVIISQLRKISPLNIKRL